MSEAFIKPGLGIVKTWQGILEICLRVAAVVLGLILLIAAATTENNVDNEYIQRYYKDNLERRGLNVPSGGTSAAAGWLIFLALIVMLYEVIVILQRFINVMIINSNILIVIIVDCCVHGVLVLGLFAGAVALAAYVNDWQDLKKYLGNDKVAVSALEDIINSSQATAAFGFILLAVDVALIIVMLLGGVFLKWDATLAKYATSEAKSSAGAE